LQSRIIPLSNGQIQSRLTTIAAIFIVLYSASLTISPAALLRSWDVSYRWGHWAAAIVWLGLFIAANFASRRWLPHVDPFLLPAAMLLAAWGTLTVWRLSPYFGLRQTIWAALAVAIFSVGARLPGNLAFLRRYKYVWLTGGLLLTAATLVLGTNPSGFGPRMWLGCCGVYLQPSEPLKILLLIYLAAYLAGLASRDTGAEADKGGQSQANARLLPLLAPTLIMTGLALILLIVQRDLGTASIILFLYTAMLYIATGKKRVVLSGALAVLLAAVTGYLLFDVVRLRIEAWINPWLDPSGRSYQIVQSLIAIANGGLIGRGSGLGAPSLVPISHSDFIFAALVEESGLIGAIAVLILLGLIAQRGLRAALRSADSFHRYLAAGLTIYLVGQSILIIGGTIRLLPLTGVTLPFVSYGGSSLLTATFSLLILMHISNQSEEARAYASLPVLPYRHLAAFLFAGLGLAALVSGWWAIQRAPALLARTDNPRRAIADRYVRRGAILDRNNRIINSSSGTPGEYVRSTAYPPLSPILGYTHPVYGQAGLEASLDDYLRGLRGNPGLDIWWNFLIYGQPPPGLDVRTTLDLDLQASLDQALDGYTGAAVLINPESGEILAMASHPGYDSNQLDTAWESLLQDESSPLLDRATLGRYPAGDLFKSLFLEGYEAYGFDHAANSEVLSSGLDLTDEPQSVLSPLQAALGAATLSAGGLRPALTLVSAVNTPSAGWVLLPVSQEPEQAIPAGAAADRIETLTQPADQFWSYSTSSKGSNGKGVTWYVSGSLPGATRTPLALALVLEADDLPLAQQIGRQILGIHP